MIYQEQTMFGDGSDGKEAGNCFAACIAAILELPIDEVPNFVDSDNSWNNVQEFLKPFGYSLIKIYIQEGNFSCAHSGFSIAFGPADRGYNHCVVCYGGTSIMDPHPANTFLNEIEGFYFFASLKPNK